MMLRIAVCEDTPGELKLISELLARYQAAFPAIACQTSLFTSAEALIADLETGASYDLYLLDIIMRGINGISLAKRLRGRGDRGIIVFITTSPEYALEAFSVRAANYLLKPLKEKDLFDCVNETARLLSDRKETLTTIQTAQGRHFISFAQILCVECMGHVLLYRLEDGQVLRSRAIRVSFESAVADLIADDRFLRPHQSFLVNAAHISVISGASLVLDDGSSIPIARFRAAEIKKKFIDYLAQRGSPQ